MNRLEDYGWTNQLEQKWVQVNRGNLRPARVIADFGTSLKVAMPDVYSAELTGKLAHYSRGENTPKVGDWVAVHLSDNGNAVVEEVLPRRSEIARKVAGKRIEKQVVAANVDLAFVLLALDGDFSIERLKRFLYQISICNIKPVIVLNKVDKTDDVNSYIDQLSIFAMPVIAAAATSGLGVMNVLELIEPAQTAILLGSSGVGKSTFTNQLLGFEAQRTAPVRTSDSKGKHTTVHRELFMLSNGGLLIDTPGIRELQLWGAEEQLDENFEDIIELINGCKYTNCRHGNEPGCSIRRALLNESLNSAHYASYRKLKTELSGLNKKNKIRKQHDSRKSHKNAKRQARDDLDDAGEV